MNKKNNNLICKANRTSGKKDHVMTKKKDGDGREYESCEKCGACFLHINI